MIRRRPPALLAAGIAALGVSTGACDTAASTPAQGSSCLATPSSMTPPGWAAGVTAPADAPRGPLRLVQDVPLPGPPNRFDYQSVDPAARRLYISHMNAGRLVIFDLDSSRVVGAQSP